MENKDKCPVCGGAVEKHMTGDKTEDDREIYYYKSVPNGNILPLLEKLGQVHKEHQAKIQEILSQNK